MAVKTLRNCIGDICMFDVETGQYNNIDFYDVKQKLIKKV